MSIERSTVSSWILWQKLATVIAYSLANILCTLPLGMVMDEEDETNYFYKFYRVRQIPLFFWKMLKNKTTEYFLKFSFLFESTIPMFNNAK